MAASACARLLKKNRPRAVFRNPLLIVPLILLCTVFAGLPRISVATPRLGILPPPDSVLIRLTGGPSALVQEQRVLSLFKGINQVAFSWSGVHLDKDSIRLTPLSDETDIRIVSTAFPPDGSSLIWEVYSSRDMVVPMVISCVPAGLDHQIAYTATVDETAQILDLTAHLILRNFSGVQYTHAAAWLNPDTVFHTDLFHLETRQIHFPAKQSLAVTKIHTWDGQIMPHDPKTLPQAPGIPFGYQFTSPASPEKGIQDLPAGKVRIFLTDSQDRTLFSGEDFLEFLPAGDTAFIKTGDSRDILVSKLRMGTSQTRVQRNDTGEIQVFDQKITDRFILENTRPTPAVVQLTDRIPGQWEPVDMGHAYTLTDYQTLVFEVRLAPGETRTFDLTYLVLNIFAGNFRNYNIPSDRF